MNKQFDPSSIIGETPPKAASFIVTIYGDAVEPRGGVLGMANLIDVCARFQISESLVRTAVSRLVSAGQLVGEREGRRSYYRLTDAARREYMAASRILFAEEPEATSFRFVFSVSEESESLLRESGYTPFGQGGWIGPDRGAVVSDGIVFVASHEVGSGVVSSPAFFGDLWDLPSYAEQYEAFEKRFLPLAEHLAAERLMDGADALSLRFSLVHAYRAILLRDPRLPTSVLPENWAGTRARKLFANLYIRLSQVADPYVGRVFQDASGVLPAESDAVHNRLSRLRLHL